jgi:hypothetical protein
MRSLRFGERFEPVRHFAEPIFPGGFRHAGIHVSVLVGFAGYGRFEIVTGGTDWKAGSRVARRFEVLQVPMRVAGFSLRRRAEHRRDIVVAFDIGFAAK